MKRIGLTLILGLAAICQAGTTQMSVTSDNLNGKATVENKILEDGSKYVRVSMMLEDAGGRSVNIQQESVYAKDGTPKRKLQVTNLAGGAAKQSVVVTFDSGGANVTVEAGGKTVKNYVSRPTGKRIEALPEFWIMRDQPKAGDVYNYYRFDLGMQNWVENKSTYHGTREIMVGGKKVKAHLVTNDSARAYMDDKGEPLRIEQNSVVLEKKS
ncbi:MAG: hypothetical protein KDC26_04870 [Armatimonadetes bacterium]|nr:hypothetical protein [Armatimonadota bacterium]